MRPWGHDRWPSRLLTTGPGDLGPLKHADATDAIPRFRKCQQSVNGSGEAARKTPQAASDSSAEERLGAFDDELGEGEGRGRGGRRSVADVQRPLRLVDDEVVDQRPVARDGLGADAA